MKREDLIKEMKNSVGNKDPIEFFSQMVDAFDLMFNRIDSLEKELNNVKRNSALSIEWEPLVASNMLSEQIEFMRQDKETYHTELSAFKAAFAIGRITQNYSDFCKFWVDTLGYHPFLDYK